MIKKKIFYFSYITFFIFYIYLYFHITYNNRIFFAKYKTLLLFINLILSLYYYSNYFKSLKINSIIYNIHKNNSLFIFTNLFMIYIYPEVILTSGDTDFSKIYPYIIENNDFSNICDYIKDYVEINNISDSEIIRKELFEYDHSTNGKKVLLPYNYIYNGKGCFPSFSLLPAFYNFIIYKILSLFCFSLDHLININKNMIVNSYSILYLEKFSASVLASVTSYLFFLFLRKDSTKYSLLLTMIYSFSTYHFSNSSQALWQHGFIEFAIVYLFISFKKKVKGNVIFLLDGLIIILSIFMRNISIFPIGIITLSFILNKNNIIHKLNYKRFEKNILSTLYKNITFYFNIYSFFGILIGALIISTINFIFYNHIFGGYNIIHQIINIKGVEIFDIFRIPERIGLVLFSPGYGLFLFNPMLLFIIYYSFSKVNRYSIILLLSLSFYILIISSYFNWNGGFSYGSRLFTELSPLIILTLSTYLKSINKINKIIYLFIFLSSVVQIIGVSSYQPFSWNSCYKIPISEKVWKFENIPYFLPFKQFFKNRQDLETLCSIATPVMIGNDYHLSYNPNETIQYNNEYNINILEFDFFNIQKKYLILHFESKKNNEMKLEIKSFFGKNVYNYKVNIGANEIRIDLSDLYGIAKVKIILKENFGFLLNSIYLE